jgi:hypothetical protein
VNAFLAPELWPFVLATGLMLAVAATEILALLVGASLWHWLDGAVADVGDSDGLAGAALGWLHLGRVPILVIIVVFLTTFAVSGFAFQFVARSAAGTFMSPLVAAGIAFLFGLAAVRVLATGLGRVMPQDETTAVSDASLVGRVGTIVIGVAAAGRPAETRIRDEFGTTHYVMVEPEGPGETFAAGASVLLVRHVSGRRFHAIRNPKPELL